MLPMLLFLLAVISPDVPMDESAAIAKVKQAVTSAKGATESAQMDMIRKLRRDLFSAEMSVNSAVVAAFGEKKVAHANWLVWSINDVQAELNESEAESDYRKLGFVFSGKQELDGVLRVLSGQQEVMFEKTYEDMYTAYVVLVPARDIAKLKKGTEANFTFRVSAMRIYPGSGVEIRGVATAVKSPVKKSK